MLVQWFSESVPQLKAGIAAGKMERLRMLEVGVLRTDNACSKSGVFDVTRIDLHSREPGIEQQNFMERPVPMSKELEKEGFDIVSLSLVVNYVGDAVGRGEMLSRVEQFLRKQKHEAGFGEFFPGLFLVLPAPCVNNSRYLDEEKLEEIMQTLGYVKVMRKMSTKLVYYYWGYEGRNERARRRFRKEEVRQGGSRNNFAIVLF